jgi:formate hydrogenlyase subunit 3/multisubunit Na+/H+ antiporter MnhD subunit
VTVLILSGAALLGSALLALLPVARRLSIGRLDLSAGLALAACVAGSVAAAQAALTGVGADATAPWQVPYGSLALHLDALAALFLLPIFVLGGLGIVYGREYLASADTHGSKDSGATWAWYYMFIVSMALVVVAGNAVLFLVAWEVMSVAGFFLVTHEDKDPAVRHAGWIFLVATHIGTAFLLAMFAILGRGAKTLDFDQLRGAADGGPAVGVVVVLALVGFGVKAGLVPAHIWLPFAHPAAPSHVSALMSGAMLKVGIYGLVRTLTLLPHVPAWAGLVILALGLLSAIYAVLLALAQHDLKRLLAFHSVENIGIICIGLGVGLLGLARNAPTVATLGFAGALLHVLNHALFKGLLFLGAGTVQHATGTRELDRLGGLLRPLPWTGATFFVGSAAISGLPPLNGFVSEFLIYSGALAGIGLSSDRGLAAAMLVTIGGLALTGGLAAACFAKAFGIVFLGLPRSEAAIVEHEPGRWMRWPMVSLALACVTIGLVPFAALRMVRYATAEASGLPIELTIGATASVNAALERVAFVALVLIGLMLVLAVLRARLLAGREVHGPTWATAYLAPNARMQYTASSFAAPLTTLFRRVVRMHVEPIGLGGYFPGRARHETRARGLIREPLFEPVFRAIAQAAIRLRWLQHGRIQLYLVNIAATLLGLLIWKLGV